MARSRTFGLLAAAVMGVTAFVGIATPAVAADSIIEFAPGEACPSFTLRIEITGTPNATRDFTDHSGNLVKQITAGKGVDLLFINTETGASVSLKANGSVNKTTFNPDGSQTVATTGHNVLILFPSDIPAGPTTTLYVGRVVFTVAAETAIFTLLSTSGRSTDICAALT